MIYRRPKLAIVGRPNVGKSALFNRICKKRIAIVDEAEGITRDRLYAEADFFGLSFEIIDTGGIDPKSKAIFNEEIKRQAEIAIEEADTLVMVVDAYAGIVSLDHEIAAILRTSNKPVCLAVNKIDAVNHDNLIHDFHSLGIPGIMGVSAEHDRNIAELLEIALDGFSASDVDFNDPSIKLAIIGRPNVGKSTFVNTLLDEERCIVSPIAGTTRDSIDVSFKNAEQQYTLIDTAGIRRKHAEHEVVDKFACIRTKNTIGRSDICMLIMDSQDGMTTQEKKIANMIEEDGKGCILLFNKWDLVKGFRMEHCMRNIREESNFLKHCPAFFISAKTGRNMDKIFAPIGEIREASQQKITTHELNLFMEATLQKTHPPMIRGKRLRIYYLAQVGSYPPTFVLFVNHPDLLTDTYKRYIYNQFRQTYNFTGLPIRLIVKGKKKRVIEQ